MKNIKIIAPSGPLLERHKTTLNIAENILNKEGFNVLYGKNVEGAENASTTIEQRISDWNDAWGDKEIELIMTYHGGVNSNQLLSNIDWNIVKDNPKPFLGASDITVLCNAIFAKTGLISYLGVNFRWLCSPLLLPNTLESLSSALRQEINYEVKVSDKYYGALFGEKKEAVDNTGLWTINSRDFSGTAVGGNLPSFSLLFGTEFFPDLTDKVVFIEWDHYAIDDKGEFDRHLESLILQPNFNKIKALVIGRFDTDSNVSREDLEKIIANKKALNSIPIVANVDFGHTQPISIIPIGGKIKYADNKFIFNYKFNF
ncbi:LD-carboxypeptidase [Candidatus Gracilibacteria bacterium]|jgi:muramoyltetrapeptide carboxypeptidase LdcA involved in peptidoglycan recycling|nr:LD-carboxypeptidase [Candidatus Gracilibacteria bacterium]